jgi:hypothetical protein
MSTNTESAELALFTTTKHPWCCVHAVAAIPTTIRECAEPSPVGSGWSNFAFA